MSTLYVIEVRASYFDQDSFRLLMADKGVHANESSYMRIAKVPSKDDEIAIGNLNLLVNQVILFVNPKEHAPVAKVWLRVKP